MGLPVWQTVSMNDLGTGEKCAARRDESIDVRQADVPYRRIAAQLLSQHQLTVQQGHAPQASAPCSALAPAEQSVGKQKDADAVSEGQRPSARV